MAKFSAYAGSTTPVVGLNNNNLNLMGTTTCIVSVLESTFGGGASASTPMETSYQRTSNAGASPPGGININRLDGLIVANVANCYGNGAWTTGPSRAAGALFGANWNAYGGVVRWLAAPGEEWQLPATANGIVCVAVSGTGLSSYHIVWTE